MKAKSERYRSGEKALTRKEYEKLIEVIGDLQDELMIKMAVGLCLRREDLTSIETKDINMETSEIYFYERKKDIRRSLALPPSLTILLTKFLKTIPKRKYLFSYRGRTAYNKLQKWLEIAGLEKRPIHALRATGIKFAHAAGWTDEQISKLTGDKIATIQEHYMTPSHDEMKEATKEKPIV